MKKPSKKTSPKWSQGPGLSYWLNELSEQAPYFAIGIVLFLSFVAMKQIMQPLKVEKEAESLSYEMPRAKSEFAFQLAGRSIERKRIGGLSEKADEVQGTAQPAMTAKAVSQPDAKKKDAKQAKKDDKKKKNNSKTAQNQKPQIKIDIQSGPDRYSQKLSDLDKGESVANAVFTGRAPVAFNPVVNDITEEEDKLTAQQWRALLFAQPTTTNRDRFLAAYRSQHIDEAAFYQIVTELFTDTASDRSKAGFELLKSTPSVKSFSILLSHYQESTSEPMKLAIAGVLKTYSDVSRFGILNQLLFAKEAAVVSAAQSLISQAISSYQNPQTISGRDSRRPGSTLKNPAPLKNFLPGLKRLVGSNSQTISQQAQNLIDTIQSLLGTPAA
jgi:hypothetical protein